MPRHTPSHLSTPAAAGESAGGGGKAIPVPQAKKRVVLGNVTNDVVAGLGGWEDGGSGKFTRAPAGTAKLNSASLTASQKLNSASLTATVSPHDIVTVKQDIHPPKDHTVAHLPNVAHATANGSSIVSPMYSGDSISTSDAMPTCDSMKKSPDFKCIDNEDSPRLASLQLRANDHLCIMEDGNVEETKWTMSAPAPMEMHQVLVADNKDDSQLSRNFASDMYTFLRAAESKKSPSTDFMEKIQEDVTPMMRAILIDWLVEVAEEYRLVPDTLYLTVNYIDRYLSGNKISHQRLQLLGIVCMLIAAKHEEIWAPQVEEFCFITDNAYFRHEVLEMESSVLNHLEYETSAPTAKCFLRRFIRAAQVFGEDTSWHLEILANYVAELSLLLYTLLSYRPSVIAASVVFVAKFMLQPTRHPWSSGLARYTRYKASELRESVRVLHSLVSAGPEIKLAAIREKYSRQKYKFVAKKHCPSSIPAEFFLDAAC